MKRPNTIEWSQATWDQIELIAERIDEFEGCAQPRPCRSLCAALHPMAGFTEQPSIMTGTVSSGRIRLCSFSNTEKLRNDRDQEDIGEGETRNLLLAGSKR